MGKTILETVTFLTKFNDANKDEWFKKGWIVLKSYSLIISETKIWSLF